MCSSDLKRGRAIQSLIDNLNRFLSAVQVGVTLAGFLSSAFGSDSLAGRYLAPWLVARGLAASVASVLAVILVTAAISFFSIVLSELTAKRLAMQRPEEFALALAPLVGGIARIATPLIWLLDKSTNVMVRILGGDPEAGKDQVTEDELRSMVANADMQYSFFSCISACVSLALFTSSPYVFHILTMWLSSA